MIHSVGQYWGTCAHPHPLKTDELHLPAPLIFGHTGWDCESCSSATCGGLLVPHPCCRFFYIDSHIIFFFILFYPLVALEFSQMHELQVVLVDSFSWNITLVRKLGVKANFVICITIPLIFLTYFYCYHFYFYLLDLYPACRFIFCSRWCVCAKLKLIIKRSSFNIELCAY